MVDKEETTLVVAVDDNDQKAIVSDLLIEGIKYLGAKTRATERDGKREEMAGGGGLTPVTIKEMETIKQREQMMVKKGDEELSGMTDDEPWQKVAGNEKLPDAGDEMAGEWTEETGGGNIKGKKNIDLGFLLDHDPFAIWAGFNHENKWAPELYLGQKLICLFNLDRIEKWISGDPNVEKKKYFADTFKIFKTNQRTYHHRKSCLKKVRGEWNLIQLKRSINNWSKNCLKKVIDDWVYHKSVIFYSFICDLKGICSQD